jgi:hypothetical protein
MYTVRFNYGASIRTAHYFAISEIDAMGKAIRDYGRSMNPSHDLCAYRQPAIGEDPPKVVKWPNPCRIEDC